MNVTVHQGSFTTSGVYILAVERIRVTTPGSTKRQSAIVMIETMIFISVVINHQTARASTADADNTSS